jgi:hypothetical protein
MLQYQIQLVIYYFLKIIYKDGQFFPKYNK